MAQHVQMFFEAAIRRALKPGDTFCRFENFSYLIMFRELSAAEAEFKCASISEEVCKRLFGENGEQVALRNLVAHVGLASMPVGAAQQAELGALLEREGMETVVTSDSRPAARPASPSGAERMLRLNLGGGPDSRMRVSSRELTFAYRPIWDFDEERRADLSLSTGAAVSSPGGRGGVRLLYGGQAKAIRRFLTTACCANVSNAPRACARPAFGSFWRCRCISRPLPTPASGGIIRPRSGRLLTRSRATLRSWCSASITVSRISGFAGIAEAVEEGLSGVLRRRPVAGRECAIRRNRSTRCGSRPRRAKTTSCNRFRG